MVLKHGVLRWLLQWISATVLLGCCNEVERVEM